MKTSHSAALAVAAITMWSLVSTRTHAQGSANLTIPVGTLTAFPTVVQTGTHPTLTWNINYPSIVQDFVTVDDPNAKIIPKRTLIADVRVLGAGVTVSNTGSYGRVFYGTNSNVNPSSIVYTKTVYKDKPLRFGGRYYYNNAWGPYHNSESNNNNVRTLVNGQVPPTTYPLHTAPTLESFIRPYLDPSGKVKIGPMDVIVFMELTHSDAQATEQGYDLQDMVLLVTFRVP